MEGDGLPTGRRVSLAFDQTVRTDLRLLEVDEAVLAEIVQQGVVIKGHADAEAFLVTKNKSFALKYVETSNLQLLLPPSTQVQHDAGGNVHDDMSASQELLSPGGLQTQVQQMRMARAQPGLLVGATTKAHLELCETRPQLHVLHALLAERPYRGPEEDEQADMDVQGGEGRPEHLQGRMEVDGASGPHGLYSFEHLLAHVQASAQQIQDELRALHALELDGACRLVDAGYLGQLLELLILSAQAEGMRLDALHALTLCTVMATDGYRPELVRHCLAVYCTPQGASATGEAETWSLDQSKVCQYFAHKVLPAPTQSSEEGLSGGGPAMAPGKGMAQQRFMAAWQAAVPSGVQVQMSMLQGEVLVDGKGPDALVHAFPVSSLPADPAARFSFLFSLRHQWESTDMEPFLVGLKVPGQTAGALLLKYARTSQPNPDGPLYFTQR